MLLFVLRERGTVEEEASHRVDTVICLSERSVMAIRSGDLNPQVGMLTDKIRVSGQIAPAVYIFNVIAPRSRPYDVSIGNRLKVSLAPSLKFNRFSPWVRGRC